MTGNTFQKVKMRTDEKSNIIFDVVFNKLHDYGTKERIDGRREASDIV